VAVGVGVGVAAGVGSGVAKAPGFVGPPLLPEVHAIAMRTENVARYVRRFINISGLR
jgi:hypothetical protein